ncbi:MAG: CotH kinase family protein [Sedimentisphaerales bacterium]|nr:CotH kinase family protein [Sedimentisphaerales bacterium]
MRIKRPKERKYLAIAKRRLSKHIKAAKILLVFLVIVIVFLQMAFFVTIFGISKHPRAQDVKEEIISTAKKLTSPANLKLPIYYVKGLAAQPEHIAINIKYKNLQKLAYMRDCVLKSGKKGFELDQFEYVPADIVYRRKQVPVKIRLKGDRIIHFDDENNWSFRIKTKNDETILGMKKFSIHKPKARNYIYEWLFHEILKREDLIALRYLFVQVTLNGKNLGIYALEEHFDKRLIENNRLREGPIIKFNEDLGANLFLSPIEIFGGTSTLESADRDQIKRAISLLELFRQGKLKVSQVFDVTKMAKYFAITDLLGTHHGAVWKSVRFYYNPVTSKLEPIGFDGHYGTERHTHIAAELGTEPDSRWLYESYGDWFRLFFNNEDTFDTEFFEEYVKNLERISNPKYLEDTFTEINDQLQHNLALIYSDFPTFGDHMNSYGPDMFLFSKKELFKRQEYIREILNPEKVMHAYYEGRNQDRIILKLGNIQKIPIQILGIIYNEETLFIPDEKPLLLGQSPSEFVAYKAIEFKIPDGFAWLDSMLSDLKLKCRVLGADQTKDETIYPYPSLTDGFTENDFMRQSCNIESFDFLFIDEARNTISMNQGDINIDRNLIVPAGYRFICPEDTKLNLSNSAMIFSYSPVEFNGTEEKPIVIESGESGDSSGQGLVVINAAGQSVIKHTVFDNLSNPSQDGWTLTGAVTFYASDVKILNCRFNDNNSEDALNIIRSDFEIINTVFNGTFSDAFDADFAGGTVKNCSFVNCGNDGIDVSGSNINIEDIYIDNAGDKGISAGEKSYMNASRIDIKNAEIALASKDLSEIFIDDVNMTGCKVGFACYQKKPEFGPALIHAENLKKDDIEIPYLIEKMSEMIVGKEQIPSNEENVKDILYENLYGRSSK